MKNSMCPFLAPKIEIMADSKAELMMRNCQQDLCKFWHDGLQEDGTTKKDCILLDTCHVLLDAQNVLRKYIRATKDSGFGSTLGNVKDY